MAPRLGLETDDVYQCCGHVFLQENLSYSTIWQLDEPHRFSSPSADPSTNPETPMMLPRYRKPVQAAAMMIQQLQQNLLRNQLEPVVLQLPCPLAESSSASWAATAASRKMTTAAAAMAALMKVAGSETSSQMVSLATSPFLPANKNLCPLLYVLGKRVASADMGMPRSLAKLSIGTQGAEVLEGGLFLPQIALTTHPHDPAGMASQVSAAHAGDPGSAWGPGNQLLDRQHGAAQHVFLTGGLGALGQLVAVWMCQNGASRGLTLAGRTGRAAAEADKAVGGQLPMWAQCLGRTGDDYPVVHMVRCDAASQEESTEGLNGQMLRGAAPAVDLVLHAGKR